MASKHDREILNAIVNPLLPLGEGVFDDEDALPENLKDEEPDSEQVRQSRGLEREAISAADGGQLSTALALLQEAIKVAPERPSCYNNRAQVHRLNGDIFAAMADLDKAIELGKGQGRSACQAFCQRGMIHRREGRNTEATADFRKAADLGSDFAKSALVSMNPYAAMCNQMLKNVFSALEQGDEQVQNPFAKEQDTTRG